MSGIKFHFPPFPENGMNVFESWTRFSWSLLLPENVFNFVIMKWLYIYIRDYICRYICFIIYIIFMGVDLESFTRRRLFFISHFQTIRRVKSNLSLLSLFLDPISRVQYVASHSPGRVGLGFFYYCFICFLHFYLFLLYLLIIWLYIWRIIRNFLGFRK